MIDSSEKQKLTDKLRSYSPTSGYSSTMRKAADEIDRLNDALRQIADMKDGQYYSLGDAQYDMNRCVRIAEEALKK